MPRDDEQPDYTVYRSRPKLFSRKETASREKSPAAGLDELRRDAPDARRAREERPREAPSRRRLRLPGLRHRARPRAGGLGGVTLGRVVKWLVVAALGWAAISLVAFLVSAQIQRANTTEAARDALDDAGYPLTSPNTILVLGSDARTKETAEPGSTVGGPSRADSILLLRTGGGRSSRLSIPRDTVVDIPGHGQAKVNAAYAIGGPSLMITTLKQFLGIEINHVIEVDFENFPQFVDALGGITVRTGCVRSDINGGRRNGGYSLRLRGGENHINGRQALALARTRKNDCKPSENDLTRARRQQKILSAIRSRIFSPATFVRGPLVGWAAPKAIRSDMSGPALLGVFGAMAIGGEPETRLLEPSGGVTLPDGGSALTVDDAAKRRAVRDFLDD